MTIKDLQKDIDDLVQPWGGYFNEMTNLALVMEELGEVTRIMVREDGQQNWKPGEDHGSLEDELVDTIFALICIANQKGYDLDAAFQKNMDKKLKRDKDRYIKD